MICIMSQAKNEGPVSPIPPGDFLNPLSPPNKLNRWYVPFNSVYLPYRSFGFNSWLHHIFVNLKDNKVRHFLTNLYPCRWLVMHSRHHDLTSSSRFTPMCRTHSYYPMQWKQFSIQVSCFPTMLKCKRTSTTPPIIYHWIEISAHPCTYTSPCDPTISWKSSLVNFQKAMGQVVLNLFSGYYTNYSDRNIQLAEILTLNSWVGITKPAFSFSCPIQGTASEGGMYTLWSWFDPCQVWEVPQ